MAAEFVERLGARMRARREELGLSMAEVARRMPGKVSENQVYRWEIGKHQPKADTLEALANVLQTDVGTLMSPPAVKGKTPDPFAVDDLAGQLDRMEAKLDAVYAVIEQIGAEQLMAALQQAASQTRPPADAERPKRAA